MTVPRHSDRRTESMIQLAEEWCDAHTIDGVGTESVGIIRSLIARLMEHDRNEATLTSLLTDARAAAWDEGTVAMDLQYTSEPPTNPYR